ncbi:type II toxin-antitoxin system RelE/ParE family toxin [Mucilaginibacter ximonensis]|uniref:Type II toxin-antitoxin system RelE/ParE family toxin n=1 Tax=Mucilaginibacter ximonensis TaxID=538021 RepID=A0ABW5YE02_9SPHI
MQFKVVFTDEADDTFDLIGRQILERWGEQELFKFRSRVYKVIDTISKSPLIFQVVDGTANLRKAVIHGNCSIFYEIKGNIISISFFWDNRQDPIFRQ